MKLQEKIQAHQRFWRGEGPSLMLIPQAQVTQYDAQYNMGDYRRRFYDPEAMWKAEMARVQGQSDWPTDGIPTVRPNLGTIFLPAIAGQDFKIQDGQMPWPGEPLSAEQIAAIPRVDIQNTDVMRLALEFYRLHHAAPPQDIAAYLPDTQGVFDVAHLLYGDEIFYDMADPDKKDRVKAILETVLDFYIRVSELLKKANRESDRTMVHGHGTPQGVYFENAGVRISEDTATLLSPAMIDEFVIPYVERAARPFGGAFIHYCGKHLALFERFAASPLVRTIDLGNPEMYDTRWLFETCAKTDTVFYGKIAALDGEGWRDYTMRLGQLVRETGVRCMIRAVVFPSDRKECEEMLGLWRQLTTL